MKSRKLPSVAAIFAVTVTLFTLSNSALADTYQIFALDNQNGPIILGLDAAGNVYISRFIGPVAGPTYYTYSNGVLVNTSYDAPDVVFDNGTPCAAPAGFSLAGSSVCNNGRIGFGSFENPNGQPNGVYTGPVSDLTLLPTFFSAATTKLNSFGDFMWVNPLNETVYEAIDTTSRVPEPTSLLLVGTGCVSCLYGIRRKFSQPA